ncbi:MAG: sulfatase, partial [Planctomycetes bacterium]|nr:sulfatase [Planctomycetota bacterium]
MNNRRLPFDQTYCGDAAMRRTLLKWLAAAALGWVLCQTATAAPPRQERPPNVVIILVDDLGWTDLTCFGSRYYETPNIDRLARQGMRFTDAYAACAVCSPTRAAVLTGRYPARVGVTDWIRAGFQGGPRPKLGDVIPEYASANPARKLICPRNGRWLPLDEVTLAEALEPAGYVSAHIGKWHLGFDDWYPDKQGFDRNIGGCDAGQPPSYFDPYYNKRQGGIPTLTPRRAGEYLTDREADEAVAFIRENRAKPFFLYMAHYAVHTPIQAKPDLTEHYKRKAATNQRNPKYAAMVHSVDEAVGRIMTTLDELKLADNTLIIFTSDNGGLSTSKGLNGPTDNAPLRSGKGFPYEGGIRVPLIVRWPAVVEPGTTSDVPVTSVDYFPTVLAAAKIELPEQRDIDGVNLLPLLSGGRAPQREAVYWHFPHYRGSVVPYSIVRAGDWKLIKRYEGK